MMHLKKIVFVFFALCGYLAVAQKSGETLVWVLLKDKPHAEQALQNPETFLSKRALKRRKRQNIKVTVSDVPVNAQYILELRNLGYQVVQKSKWINAVVVPVQNTLEASFLTTLPFVLDVRKVAQMQSTQAVQLYKTASGPAFYSYGAGQLQIQQMNGQFLHELGYSGEGMLIAVLDAGFSGVDQYPSFDSLNFNNGILFTKDFVDGDANVYHGSSHGTSVLSVMAANLSGDLVGTAPKANYALIRTESEGSETKQEEYNWIAGAEYADSIGADLINSSLGYNTFDGGIGDYSFSDLNGQKAIVTRGAQWAQRKGILVCNSMGNEGSTSWKRLLAPADADSILSVGGVDNNGIYAPLSGVGPTADGRLKPNVSAQAVGVNATGATGGTMALNGTSFASPLVCGLAACLWQSNLSKNYFQILQVIERSASQYFSPDSLLGYGIPNFNKAFWLLDVETLDLVENVKVYPSPFKAHIYLKLPNSFLQQTVALQLFNIRGSEIFSVEKTIVENNLEIDVPEGLPKGVYILHLATQNKVQSFKLIH